MPSGPSLLIYSLATLKAGPNQIKVFKFPLYENWHLRLYEIQPPFFMYMEKQGYGVVINTYP
jgi:hypothetical protein